MTEFGLTELEAMARAEADQKGPCLNVGSSNEFFRVPTLGSSTLLTVVEATRTKFYPSQSPKSLLKDFFQLNPFTHMVAAHQTTSLTPDQMIQLTKAFGLEVPLASFGMLEDLLLKFRLIAGKSGDVEKACEKSSFPGPAGIVTFKSVTSVSVYSLPTISVSVEIERVAVIGSHDPCLHREVDEALSSVRAACGRSRIDSLKTLNKVKLN